MTEPMNLLLPSASTHFNLMNGIFFLPQRPYFPSIFILGDVWKKISRRPGHFADRLYWAFQDPNAIQTIKSMSHQH